jgi:hypothetical protein
MKSCRRCGETQVPTRDDEDFCWSCEIPDAFVCGDPATCTCDQCTRAADPEAFECGACGADPCECGPDPRASVSEVHVDNALIIHESENCFLRYNSGAVIRYSASPYGEERVAASREAGFRMCADCNPYYEEELDG